MKSVLVVDDHVDTNGVLCKLLRKLGYTAFSALNGEKALAELAVQKPDLVILDAMMPGMDGMEVLRHIRSNPQTAKLPVILYSAIHDREFQQHALDRGANEYWVKSGFSLVEFRTRIARYFEEPAPPPPA